MDGRRKGRRAHALADRRMHERVRKDLTLLLDRLEVAPGASEEVDETGIMHGVEWLAAVIRRWHEREPVRVPAQCGIDHLGPHRCLPVSFGNAPCHLGPVGVSEVGGTGDDLHGG